MSSFFTSKKKNTKSAGQKLVVFLVSFCLIFTFIAPPKPARAQIGGIVSDVGNTLVSWGTWIWDQTTTVVWEALKKAGSIAFQRTLSTALNKIAYDTATWLGSGMEGQKPMFITESWEKYLWKIGDEAAGQFIESFVNNLSTPDNSCHDQLIDCKSTCTDRLTMDACVEKCSQNATNCTASATRDQMNATPSFNVCSPSSLEAKIRIGLGLVEQNRPQGPNCSVTEMIKTWDTDINQKLKDLRRDDYLSTFVTLFDPASNDLGISVLARSDLSSELQINVENSKLGLNANKGWLDVRNIAGMTDSAPGSAERELETAKDVQEQNFGKITGDVFVDASSVFLNQLALSAFNTLLRSLAKQDNNSISSSVSPNPEEDNNSSGGVAAVKQVTTKLLKPNFGVRTDYDVLSSLAICPDPKKPGPDNCVIDDKLMQAITERKTVGEALAEGYLHGGWQVTVESSSNSYSGVYSLRNISILRKYRIVPVGWEEAIRLLASDPANPRKANFNDLVSCFDKNDEYNTFSAEFPPDHGWCEGLVDPNWVLKAPLNFCKKEGIGAQILSDNIIPGVTATNYSIPSTYSITRADGYCADNQSCIKEKDDGSCEAYGYCNEEKRTWNFNTDSCQPINNTCQSFSGSSGRKFSYLENTLDYGDCTLDNSGCRQYSLYGSYATSTGVVSWSSNQNLYLSKNLSTCTKATEGCTGLLRVKSMGGVNLVMDSGLTNINDMIGASSVSTKLNDWPIIGSRATIVDASQEPGGVSGKVIKLEGYGKAAGVYSNPSDSLLPANFQIISGQSYTLSADVYLAEGLGVTLAIGSAADGFTIETAVKNSWQHLSITRPANSSYNEPIFSIVGGQNVAVPDVTFYLKNLKFEMSGSDTGFSSYGASKFYERLLPGYLEKTCYVDATSASKNYNLKPTAPTVCSNYARKCNKDEVGCESFTSAQDNFTVAAKVTDDDYCPKECLGYDVYIAKASYFNSAASENMIPAKATSCAAEASGCSEFTNLDTLGRGGEQKEYYTKLKQCIKPSPASCASFYSWEGTEGGYQLKAYSLKKDASNMPAITIVSDSAFCNATIFHLPVSDPAYNADCREFYNAAGQVSYHLNSITITCSENCHSYRMSGKNIDETLNIANCTGASKHWDAASGGTCISCLNGGTWDNIAGACVYQAIPGEGQTCGASDNGCREYNGNNGSNVQLKTYHDFEEGLSGWTSPTNGAQISAIANNNNGHSLLVSGGAIAQLKVSNLVNAGSAYSLKFLARSLNSNNFTVYFINPATGLKSEFGAVKIKSGNEWDVYQTNLAELDHSIGQPAVGQIGELLVISGSSDFYIDDFVLSEITDRYYLIKNSSQVPDACYYDNFNQYQGGDYNLGCAQYTDRSGKAHNLHKFTGLCSDSAVGCEQMIDTKNYSPYGANFWENGIATSTCDMASNPDCVKVDGDSAIYAVYDSTKSCSSANQGCSRLGEGQGGANFSGWSDVFKNNNPDQYNDILCGVENLGCEEWKNTDDNTLSYFKDPGSATCVYRVSNNAGIPGKRWYKIPVKRCDLNNNGKVDFSEGTGKVCNDNNSCGGNKCLIDNNDYNCPVSYVKTIGFGGDGNQTPVPDGNAGLCDAEASTCSEYIDPVSKFSPNLVVNPEYQLIGGTREGWGSNCNERWNGSLLSVATQQVVRLEPYKLYAAVVTYNAATSTVKFNFLEAVRRLKNDNNFGAEETALQINSNNIPVIFNSRNNKAVLIEGGNGNNIISIKELVVDYQLRKDLNSNDCNGQVKYNNGCVLFNARTINGAAGLADLSQNWDAYLTEDGKAPSLCSSTGSCTANKLIKVRPNRVCAKWLDCISYIQDSATKKKMCYAFAECDRLDDKGECANFINPEATALNINPKVNQNSTGYSLANKYTITHMALAGQSLELHEDFETGKLVPLCSNPAQNFANSCIINSPDDAQNKSATDYPAHGKGYIKVASTTIDVLKDISVKTTINDEFYINYLVNTKKSAGASAQITITASSTTVLKIKLDSRADTGWERKVDKIKLGAGQKTVTITLSANPSTGAGPVYFDDINIDQVLKISNDTYAAPECRLYPTSDSLTCDNINKNVVSDGLQGYCLEHDPINKGVCLLWYPMDNIPVSSRSSLGYNGNFPLNYCTEVSGNFDLMEKRVGYRLDGFDEDYLKIGSRELGDPSGSGCNGGGCYGCFAFSNPVTVIRCHNGCWDSGMYCPADYDIWISSSECSGGSCEDHYNFMCVPKTTNLKFTETAYHDDSANGGNWSECQNHPYSVGYAVFNGFDGHEESQNPKLRIQDYEVTTNSESDLKLIPGTSGTGQYYHFNCNKLIQTISNAGENSAWVNRVASDSTYPLASTSPLFKSPYLQSADKAPYGAATLPETYINANDEVVKLKDLENKEIPYAGRPYGCANGVGPNSGKNCEIIGTCSNNPSIFCLATTTVKTSTCTGNGTCVALWDRNIVATLTPLAYKDVFKNIFLKTTAAFSTYKSGSKLLYQTNSGLGFNYTQGNDARSPLACPGNIRPSYPNPYVVPDPSYCGVLPSINNVKLYYNDNNVVLTSNAYDIKQKGIYRLEFNTTVDSEQQPLKKLKISWGDGYEDIVTNQDHHPLVGLPHIFYHYYAQTGLKTVGIKVTDNWEFYKDY